MSETTPEPGQNDAPTAPVEGAVTETSPGTGSLQDAAPIDADQTSEADDATE